MSNVLPIPKLTRGSCFKTSITPMITSMNMTEFFNYNATFQSKDDPFESSSQKKTKLYDVELVLAKEGSLSLGLPVSPGVGLSSSDSKPLRGVSLECIPITEEEAFAHPNDEFLQASHFTIPRGQISVNRIIDRIKKVGLSDNIHEIVPKTPNTGLYCSTFISTFNQLGEHRFAKFDIRLQPVKKQGQELIAVVARHIEGDTRLSMEFFITLREYVMSNGTTERNVPNPIFHGAGDRYLYEMTEPLTIFTESKNIHNT